MANLEIKSLLENFATQQQTSSPGDSYYFTQGSFEAYVGPLFEKDKQAFVKSYIDVIKGEIESKITEDVLFKNFHYLDILPLSKFIRARGYMFAVFDVINEDSLVICADKYFPGPKLFLEEYTRRFNSIKSVLDDFRVPIYSEDNALRLFLIRKLFIGKNLDKVIAATMFTDLIECKELAMVISSIYKYDIKSRNETIEKLNMFLKNSISEKLNEFVLENSDAKSSSEIKDGLTLYLNYTAQLRKFIIEVKQNDLTATFYSELKSVLLENKQKLSYIIVTAMFEMNHVICMKTEVKKAKVEDEGVGSFLLDNITFLENLAEISTLLEDEVFFATILKDVFIKCSIQFSKKMLALFYNNYSILFNNVITPTLQPKLDTEKGETFHSSRFNFNNYSKLETNLKKITDLFNEGKKKDILNILYCDNRQPKGLVFENGLNFDKVKGPAYFRGIFLEKSKKIKNSDKDDENIQKKFYKNSVFTNYKIQLKSNTNVCLVLNELQLIIYILIGKSKGLNLNQLKNNANMPFVLLEHTLSTLVELKVLLLSKKKYKVHLFTKETNKLLINAFSYDYKHHYQFFAGTIKANSADIYNLVNYMSKIISREGSISVEKALKRLDKHYSAIEDKEIALKDTLDKFKEYFVKDKETIVFKME